MTKIYGNINSVESMGLVDGPGIRYVVFMQGCKLRCLYCHNPETWDEHADVEKITPQNLIKKILRYKNYFGNDGGVTFSGGEPLLQSEFLIECLKLCKANNLHTALDTAGVGFGDYEEILNLVDLVILDVKAVKPDDYRKLTGQTMEQFDMFIKALIKAKCDVWIRQVIVPGINDTKENVLSLNNYIKQINNVKKVELLPYKTMGVHKYEELKIPYRLKGVTEMNENKIKTLENFLKY